MTCFSQGLPEEELAAMKTKFETLPFAKCMEDLSDEVKTALRKYVSAHTTALEYFLFFIHIYPIATN